MSGSICSSNVTSGFIDLATFDEIEKYMYGGPCALAYFVRETRKSTWFTQVPVVLTSRSNTPNFNQEWSVCISRAGDYLLQTWLRLTTPEISLNALATSFPWGYKGSIRWTRNLMHNLIKDCCITFNDLVAARFDNYFLDFWTAFTVPAGKRNGYNNMIGNIDDLTSPHCAGEVLPATTLNLPLPFWYSRDSGVALPTAALPYNEMRINFSFRDWKELLIVDYCCKACVDGNCFCTGSPSTLNPSVPPNEPYPCASGFSGYNACYKAPIEPKCGEKLSMPVCDASWLCGGVPTIGQCQVWANYAIVSNDERKRMACAPRDILIEQSQMTNRQCFNPCNNKQPQYDIRFSHAIKVLFFAVRNTTNAAEWSNYTTASPVVNCYNRSRINDCGHCPRRENNRHVDFSPLGAADPILQTSLVYENTSRLAQMGSDYFSLINPYYHAPSIPYETGYHMYSYSLDFICLDPMGSTNYGKLTNVSIYPEASQAAVDAANVAKPTGNATYWCDLSCTQGCTSCTSGCSYKGCNSPSQCPTSNCGACSGDANESNRCAGTPSAQSFEFICVAVNNNIVRISGGKTPRVPPTADCYESYDNTFVDKQCNLSSFNNNLIECM